jgi:hypothetical protein
MDHNRVRALGTRPFGIGKRHGMKRGVKNNLKNGTWNVLY